MPPLRTIFMGSAELSCPSLAALLESADFQVLAIVTQPDRPKGRDLKVKPTPVKALALEKRLPVLQPERARDQGFISRIRELQPDLTVVVAYGQILPKDLLEAPRFGSINVHTSLLPRYRGAAPIQWAILDGEAETGVTIMKMDEGLDTGPMLAQQRTEIASNDNAQSLHDKLATIGARLLLSTLPPFVSGQLTPVAQPAQGATYARKIRKSDGAIDWSMPARSIWNRVRGLVPWPCAFTYLKQEAAPQLLKFWDADVISGSGPAGEVLSAGKEGIVIAAGVECLRVFSLQREGGRRMSARDFLTGHPIPPGACMISEPAAPAAL